MAIIFGIGAIVAAYRSQNPRRRLYVYAANITPLMHEKGRNLVLPAFAMRRFIRISSAGASVALTTWLSWEHGSGGLRAMIAPRTGADAAFVYLTSEEDEHITAVHRHAAEIRTLLDEIMRAVRDDVVAFGAELVGVECSVKDLDDFRGKIARTRGKWTTIEQLRSESYDLNRYALTFPPERYADGQGATYVKLEDSGFELRDQRNAWRQPHYKGINTTWRHIASDQLMEVQFHTPESWETKQRNHVIYQVKRGDTSLSQEEVFAADHLQAEAYHGIGIPSGYDRHTPALPSSQLPNVSEKAKQRVRDKADEVRRQRMAAVAGSVPYRRCEANVSGQRSS